MATLAPTFAAPEQRGEGALLSVSGLALWDSMDGGIAPKLLGPQIIHKPSFSFLFAPLPKGPRPTVFASSACFRQRATKT